MQDVVFFPDSRLCCETHICLQPVFVLQMVDPTKEGRFVLVLSIVHPKETCQGKITLFWAVKFSGDQAIKRAMKPAKMVGTAQPWRFHSGMGGGSTLNFKGSTPRAHCDPVENTSRHDKARWSWSSPILLVCFPMCLIKPILASQTPCLVFVEGDILSLLLLTLAN